jgi:hypothetical protein
MTIADAFSGIRNELVSTEPPNGMAALLPADAKGILFVRVPNIPMASIDRISTQLNDICRRVVPGVVVCIIPAYVELELLTRDQLRDIKIQLKVDDGNG